ncbi:hypothetical protein [Agrobacterium pusense]|uniref:hypothetical protein n=1 Tax=Agrobacterium pusense TaxID=648995 RepID=UPI000D379AD4|nr:hypothetical protein [Agrobacterium pusense]PTV70247.1 hypothetical protein DBL06_25625 [Agrobacterium pusense]
MADQINQPHVLIRLGGTHVVATRNRNPINALLGSLKRKDAKYTFGFEGLQHRCNRAEAMLTEIGLPDTYWDGVTFYAYSVGPAVRARSNYGFQSIVGIGVKVQRIDGEWVLLDAYKTGLSAEESGEPHFQPFTSEQWSMIPDPDDDPNPYKRQPSIKFTVTK